MASRGHMPSSFEGRSNQAPGMMRHGPFPGLGPAAGHRPVDPLPPPEFLENKVAVQVAEMERLARENQRLASTHVALRKDLVATQQEAQRIQAHTRSIQTESDIQIRVLLEKITKMEADVRTGESLKKDLEQVHMEAKNLVTERHELVTQIQKATEDLQKTHAEVKKLPEMHAELDSLRKEHQRLRTAFESEKNLNIEQVEQMQAMEKNLISLAREVEKLRAEVSNAEKMTHAQNPYGASYGGSNSYPTPVQGSFYGDSYGRPQVQFGNEAQGQVINPYISGNGVPSGGGTSGQSMTLYGNGNPIGGGGAAGQGMNMYGSGVLPPADGATAAALATGNGGGWGGSYDSIRGPAPSSFALR